MDRLPITNPDWVTYHSTAVIPGAKIAADGTPSPALVRRVEFGCSLYHRGVVQRLLLSGGAVGSPLAEAEWMYCHARTSGVPAAALVVESQARTTRDNARLSCQSLLAANLPPGPVLVISDLYHLPRCWMVFRVIGRRSGLQFRFRACPPPRHAWRSRGYWKACLRELPALVVDSWRCWRVRPPRPADLPPPPAVP